MAVISVIVPVYKVEKYLERCVDSILNQTFANFQLILIDDGSPDHCGEICDIYAKKDKRVIVIHRKNGGLSAARNTGLEWIFTNDSSDYITFIDSDDWIHPQYLEILLTSIEINNVAVSVGQFQRVKEYETTNQKKYEAGFDSEVLETEDFLLKHEWNFNYAWGKLYCKKYFRDIRYPEGKIFEDTFTTYKVLFKAKTVAFVDYPLYYYFYNPEGISHSQWEPSELVIMEGLKEQIKFYKENGFVRALEKEEELYLNHFAYQISRIRANKNDYKENRPYIKSLRKEMMKLIYKNPEKYGYRKMPQCYEAAYPRLMKIYHFIGYILRKILKIVSSR